MKTALKILLMLGIIGYIAFAIVKFSEQPEEAVCEAVDIEFSDEDETPLVDAGYVSALLTKHKFSPEGQLLKATDLNAVEEALEQDAYINKAKCYYKANNHLCIRVTTLRPILHVITANEDYYIDTTGVAMPVGDFNLDLCIATGNINRKTIKQQLIPLAWFIHQDAYWSQQVEQLDVNAKGEVCIIPREGTHRILLGKPEGFETKLANMRLFNEQGFPKVGWNKYKAIDLRYSGQVIGIK